MEYVVPGLVYALFLLMFVFRQPIKRWSRQLMETEGAQDDEKLVDIIARELFPSSGSS